MNKLRGRTYRKRKKRKLEAVKNSNVHYQADLNYNQLLKWMGENGFKATKSLRPKCFLETGRGLMTKEPIKAGDLILTIPQNLLITTEVVLKSELGAFIKKYCPHASGQQILSIFLMFEKSKGKASEWNSYMETLPDHYDIPAFYRYHCISALPPFIYEQSLKQVQAVSDSYTELNLLIRNMECSFPFLHGYLNFGLYKWAWCTVNTRCVYIDCFRKDCIGKLCKYHLAMAPFLDLLNHSANVQVQAGFSTKRKRYEIVSLCNIEKYSQVFISYGSHDNKTLFLEYGFTVPNNSNDTILFSIDDILSAYEQCKFSSHSLSRKLEFIKENELIRNIICSCDGLSWNLNIILRILSSNCNTKWWKSRFSNDLKFMIEDQDAFTKLRTAVLHLKMDELKKNQIISKLCTCDHSILQLNVSQLLLIENSILIKAIEQ